MGGNALKRFELSTKRLPASEFRALCDQVRASFAQRFPGVRLQPIPAYASKVDFGDLDVLVSREGLVAAGGVEALEEWCVQAGHSRGQERNGPVTSVEWRTSPNEQQGFQVDFITSPDAEFDMALHYYAFNDLGNLVGRIAHKMGLVYGHNGLLFPMRDDTHEFDRLLVCADPRRSLSFLGYDPDRFARGFENLEEIFSFVVSSPYFNKSIYLLENRNHASRTRDRKRKTYREFLEWVDQKEGLGEFEFPEDKSSWLPHIFASFPGFEAQYRASWDRLQKSRNLRTQFNGQKVGEMSGLSGKELGHLMSRIRQELGTEQIEKMVAEGGIEALRPTVEALVASLTPKPRPGM